MGLEILIRGLASAEWMASAACRTVDPAVFFLEGEEDGGHPTGTYAAARAICAICPVVVECLDYAMRTNQNYGVWGGLPPRDRRILRRSRNQAA